MIKKLAVTFAMCFLLIISTLSTFATSQTIDLKDADLKVEIPEEFVTLTRNMKKDDSNLSVFGYDNPEQVNKQFKANNIFLNTSPKNGEYGITIAVTETSASKNIFELSKYKDKDLENIITKAKTELAKTVILTDSKIYKNKGNTFIVLKGKTTSKNVMYVTQYFTIYNGKQYTFNMYYYNHEPSQMSLDVHKNMVDSVQFTKNLKRPFSLANPTGNPTVDKCLWVGVVILIGLIIMFINKGRKKSKQIPESTKYRDRLNNNK